MMTKHKLYLVFYVLLLSCIELNILDGMGEKQPPSTIKLVHFLFKQARESNMSKTCVENSTSVNEGLFVSSRTALLCYFIDCFLPALSRFYISSPALLRRGRVREQLLGVVLQMLLRKAIVKKPLISKLSGFIIKA